MSTVNIFVPLAFSTSNVVVVFAVGVTFKLLVPIEVQLAVPSPSSILEAELVIPLVSSATLSKLLYVFAGDFPAKLPISLLIYIIF